LAFLLLLQQLARKGSLYVNKEQLLTVPEVAELLRVKPSWIYDHADELGAFRLGKYLRFSLARLMERLENAQFTKVAA
jgi:hypothetical protein